MKQAPTALEMAQSNELARRMVVGSSVKLKQQIFSQNVDISAQNVINLGQNVIRNAGLLLGFIVEVEGEVTNGSGGTATRTTFGTANMVNEFRFDDLSNYTRIQTSGRHVALLNSVRHRSAFGGAYSPGLPMDYGDNFGVFDGSASIAADGTDDLRHVYYLPISYSHTDLRGAMYMSTVSAAANLQITLNNAPFTAAGNPVGKVFAGSDGDWTDNVRVTVYQIYLDQLPRTQDGQPILPMDDLDTVYDLKQTTFSGMTVAQDFPMAFSSYRAFLSTILVYDNGGTLGTGGDVNYFALTSANFSNLFKISPKIAALEARMAIMSDLPDGTYLFDSRDTPINTINFGNMELNLNAATVNADARAIVGYEAFAKTQSLRTAPSLAGG